MKTYDFEKKNAASKIGVSRTIKYLESFPDTIRVQNVEDDQNYQRIDVDLLWECIIDEQEFNIPIEVKTDEYISGNFWFETWSNKALKTKGCFLKTAADRIFYYFIRWDRAYILPTTAAKEWLIKNMERFRESETSTLDGKGGIKHITVGKIVPITIVIEEVPGVQIIENFSKFNNS